MSKSKRKYKFQAVPRLRPLIVISCFIPRLVDRYIPGYHFLVEGVTTGGYDETTAADLIPPWMLDEPQKIGWKKSPPARCLRIIIDEKRRVRKVEYCRRQ
jgi:hypothetical protein